MVTVNGIISISSSSELFTFLSEGFLWPFWKYAFTQKQKIHREKNKSVIIWNPLNMLGGNNIFQLVLIRKLIVLGPRLKIMDFLMSEILFV